MSHKEVVATVPAPIVHVEAADIYQRVLATTPATTLVSLMAGGVIPDVFVPNTNASMKYVFGGVDLASEVNPLATIVRYTDNGTDAPTATLGFVLPQEPSWVRIYCNLNHIQLCSAGADVQVQVRLIVTDTTPV